MSAPPLTLGPWEDIKRRLRYDTAYQRANAAYALGYEAGVADERARQQDDAQSDQPVYCVGVCARCGRTAQLRARELGNGGVPRWLCAVCHGQEVAV